MEIGAFIRKNRKEKKLTLKEVANEVGLSQTYLSQLELGDRNVSPDILEKISKVLDVPYLDLMTKAGFIKETEINQLTNQRNDLLNVEIARKSETRKLIEESELLEEENKTLLSNPNLSTAEKNQVEVNKNRISEIRNLFMQYMKDSNERSKQYNSINSKIADKVIADLFDSNNCINLEKVFNGPYNVNLFGKQLSETEQTKALTILNSIFN